MKKLTIQEKAKKMLDCFEQKKRQDESKFYCLKDDCKNRETYQEICMQAHGDMFPDDYKYEFIVEALQQLSDMTEDADPQDTIFEIESDIYTSDLTKWLDSANSRVYYLTEALEEYPITDGFQALSSAQLKEKQEVAFSILQSLEEI
jgi:hypothetical protein